MSLANRKSTVQSMSSPGWTSGRPAWAARIFSVIVMAMAMTSPSSSLRGAPRRSSGQAPRRSDGVIARPRRGRGDLFLTRNDSGPTPRLARQDLVDRGQVRAGARLYHIGAAGASDGEDPIPLRR